MKNLLRRFKQLLLLLWLILIVGFGFWFSTENNQPIQVSLIGYTFPKASIALYLAFAMSIGAFFGWLVTFLSVQKTFSQKKRDLKKVKKEVDKLRSTYPEKVN